MTHHHYPSVEDPERCGVCRKRIQWIEEEPDRQGYWRALPSPRLFSTAVTSYARPRASSRN